MKYEEILERYGFPLCDINPGSDEVALLKEHALRALDAINNDCAISGGDVLKLSETGLEYAYASWFCNKQPEEGQNYRARSIEFARKYISEFKPLGDYSPLFVFVLSK